MLIHPVGTSDSFGELTLAGDADDAHCFHRGAHIT